MIMDFEAYYKKNENKFSKEFYESRMTYVRFVNEKYTEWLERKHKKALKMIRKLLEKYVYHNSGQGKCLQKCICGLDKLKQDINKLLED
jgi:hypothetical protein